MANLQQAILMTQAAREARCQAQSAATQRTGSRNIAASRMDNFGQPLKVPIGVKGLLARVGLSAERMLARGEQLSVYQVDEILAASLAKDEPGVPIVNRMALKNQLRDCGLLANQ